MIALDDVAKLWTVDLGENIIAAVEDAGFPSTFGKKWRFLQNLCVILTQAYLLIDVKKWLNLDVTTKVLKIY